MRLPRGRLVLVGLAILIMAGCTVVGEGDPLIPIFCTAHTAGLWDVYAYVYGALLLVWFPIILLGLFLDRLRGAAIVVGVLTLGGLSAQPILLNSGLVGCDLL